MENETREQKLNDCQAVLDWLRAHPEVDVVPGPVYRWMYSELDKDAFLAAARAFGTFTKTEEGTNKDRIAITKRFGSTGITFSISRSVVCKKVKVLKEVEDWECEPLLSAAEMSELEAV